VTYYQHLPECPMLEPLSDDTKQHCYCSSRKTACIHDEMECICDELLACEERITAAAVQRVEALAKEWEETTLAVRLALGIALGAIKGDQE